MPHPELTPAQRELIANLPSRFPPERIDRLWLFPPHVGNSRESGFVVLSLLPTDDQTTDRERRTLVTVRYESFQEKGRTRREERLVQEGTAPPDGIERVIAGVIRRSNQQEAVPLVEGIGGRPERWDQLLDRLGFAA